MDEIVRVANGKVRIAYTERSGQQIKWYRKGLNGPGNEYNLESSERNVQANTYVDWSA